MKANLNNILGRAALGMALLANTVPSWAGSVSNPGVVIESTSTTHTAYGSMVGARYSADNRQYIGCSINAAPSVVCIAQNSAGNYVGCVSNDPRHIDWVQRMTDSSYIYFEVDRATAGCTLTYIGNGSSFLK